MGCPPVSFQCSVIVTWPALTLLFSKGVAAALRARRRCPAHGGRISSVRTALRCARVTHGHGPAQVPARARARPRSRARPVRLDRLSRSGARHSDSAPDARCCAHMLSTSPMRQLPSQRQAHHVPDCARSSQRGSRFVSASLLCASPSVCASHVPSPPLLSQRAAVANPTRSAPKSYTERYFARKTSPRIHSGPLHAGRVDPGGG